jgi:DNA-directed RNA polymerase specialized sigma24 family protein
LTELDASHALIHRALAGESASVRELVDRLSPVISRRVAATLWKRTRKRNVPQEVDDIAQEVLLSLFQADGKTLRSWDPARGMSLDRFVGMLAQHLTISILRNGRTSPWRDEPTEAEKLDELDVWGVTPESVTISRQNLQVILDRMRAALSPRGLILFQRIVVDEEPLDAVMADEGLSQAAAYQWRCRLLQTLRNLASDVRSPRVSERSPGLRMPKRVPQT